MAEPATTGGGVRGARASRRPRGPPAAAAAPTSRRAWTAEELAAKRKADQAAAVAAASPAVSPPASCGRLLELTVELCGRLPFALLQRRAGSTRWARRPPARTSSALPSVSRPALGCRKLPPSCRWPAERGVGRDVVLHRLLLLQRCCCSGAAAGSLLADSAGWLLCVMTTGSAGCEAGDVAKRQRADGGIVSGGPGVETQGWRAGE
jgi:hypothetical protein